jgi:NADP-dependent 3-hydroxy acid dehydrogenase YdfG
MADISKAVLVTGCSTGIGRATAEHLASKGWKVYATARKPESITDLEAKGCKLLALDVCDESSMQAAVSAVEQAEGAVGVLVNNAGYSQSGAVESVPLDQVRRQFETNVFGLVRMVQLVLPGMRRQGWGKIVNISSMGGKLTFPGGGFYHGTKHAVEAISDALRWEVRGFGIDVVVIEPGLIKTQFGETAVGSIDGAAQDGPYAKCQVQRSGRDRHGRRLRGPDGPSRCRARGRREEDREGDQRAAAEDPLSGDRLRPPGHDPAQAAHGPDVGRDAGQPVPAAPVTALRAGEGRRGRRSGSKKGSGRPEGRPLCCPNYIWYGQRPPEGGGCLSQQLWRSREAGGYGLRSLTEGA